MVLVGACGFEYEQAAEIAGCAPGTIKSRVSRGRRDVKALLDEDNLDLPRMPAGRTGPHDGLMEEIDTQLGLAAE
jgi:RNA polymerase sigma-70 factor (ECF subfamily)